MVRSLLTDQDGKVKTVYFDESPNNNHDWKEIPDDSYIEPVPDGDYRIDMYLKSESDDKDWDEETEHLGILYVERSTSE